MVNEFEEEVTQKDERNQSHHEQTLAHQRFTSDVKSMVQTLEELGNPFEEESDDIVALVTKEVASTAVNHSVQVLKDIGKKQYETFWDERLVKHSKPLNETIKKNKLPLFKDCPVKEKSKGAVKLQTAKDQGQLFANLYIGCQNRSGNLDDFLPMKTKVGPHCSQIEETCEMEQRVIL